MHFLFCFGFFICSFKSPMSDWPKICRGWRRADQQNSSTWTHSKIQNCDCPHTPMHSHSFRHQAAYKRPPLSAPRWRASNCWIMDKSLVLILPTTSLFINSTHLFRIGPKQGSMSSQWLQLQFRGERNLWTDWGMRHRQGPRYTLDLHTPMMCRGPGWTQLPLLQR